jgi:AcrR family transcriptional regulator
MADRTHEIQAAGYAMMGASGLESVHARTIGAKLGINHATVHYYFTTRADLLAGICEFAQEQLRSDRKGMGEAATPRDVFENELALTEAYSRSSSRFAKVMIGLCAAAVNEKALVKPVRALVREYTELHHEAASNARLKAGSPFAQPDLFASAAFGLMALSHLGAGPNTDEALDAMFSSMF